MKIQIISEYFYPDNFRINDITQHLVDIGNTVYVLTGLPDYTTGRIDKKYRLFKNRREQLFGAKVVRVTTFARRTGAFFRGISYGSFMVNSFFYSLFCKKPNTDVIYVYGVTPVFQLLPGVVFKKRTGKKLVVYCCDLWPESLKAWRVKESSLLFKAVKKFSIYLYNKCDTIAITSKPFKEYLINVCKVAEEKIVYLPQHFNDDFKDIVGEYEDNGCADFLFAGNMGAAQKIDCIIKAAKELPDSCNYKVHLVGSGSEESNLKNLVKEYGLENKVIFHGRFPEKEMKYFYKMADCYLVTLEGQTFIGKTLPSKIQGYLSIGKSVLGAINGAGQEVIAEADCGGCVDAEDYKGLAKLMEEFVADPEKFKEKGRKGRAFFEKYYTKEKFFSDFIKILKGKGDNIV